MTSSIIGSGHVGAALAGLFAASNRAVGIANTRGPDSLASIVHALGDRVVPQTLQDALKADVVILAVPFRAHTIVAQAREDWSGTIVVDAMNTYGVAPEELQGRVSSDVVADAFPGARVVKTLNQLPAKLLAKDPAEHGGRRVMFVAGNDAEAEAAIAKLVGDLGFAPITLGRVDAGGVLIGLGGPLVLQNLVRFDR